jgi:hypothetical protein
MTEQGSGRETQLTCILPRGWKVYFEPLVRYPAAHKVVQGSCNTLILADIAKLKFLTAGGHERAIVLKSGFCFMFFMIIETRYDGTWMVL